MSKRPIFLQRVRSDLRQEMLRFVFASVLDIFMTFLLLYSSAAGWTHNIVQESNPVARIFIDRWGMRGMVYFKLVVVAFVIVLVQIISQQKPTVARWILNGGTLVVAVVVGYSLMMLSRNLIF